MIIKALLEGSIKGVGKFHRTSVFPCSIFQYMKGVNDKPGTPNYDMKRLALKSTALRLYPNYANCDVSMQKDWVKYDRKKKEEYINSLSTEDLTLLAQRLEEHPKLQKTLMLEITEDKKIKVKQDELPIEIMSTMGCRTQNGADINAIEDYIANIQAVLKDEPLKSNFISAAQKDGRGNICPVTIILPTIAKEAIDEFDGDPNDPENKDKLFEAFMERLDLMIHDAKDMLIERFDYISSQNPASAKFMYENNTMYGYIPEEGIRSALKHGTLALGQIGISNTLYLLFGYDHTTEKGMEYAKKIQALFKQRCAEFKEQYKLNMALYNTPAESLCYTAMNKFKEKYGEIPFVSDKEYFTNSIHVPVWKEISPFEKIDIESQLTGYSGAGCITYVELEGAVLHNIDALEKIVDHAMDKDVPYFAINVPNDICLGCGYQGLINDNCPQCNSSNIERLRRTTGYLTGNYTTAFNPGKIAEVRDRYKHSKKLNLCDQ